MSIWGHLADRYETNRSRAMLALDGGGIRGVLTLEVLAEIERQLRESLGKGSDFRLCDFFDYIGGSSTGAIIAAGLARGMSVAQLIDKYQDLAQVIFTRQFFFKKWTRYSAKPLSNSLQELLGKETTLEPRHLRCLLLVVAHNLATNSPWPISSNPQAKYNDPARPDSNLRIPLWRAVRGSTAAPTYFPPEEIQLGRYSYLLQDGGITPYNNPAFLLYRMATEPGYRLEWAAGERELLLVSIGTGEPPPKLGKKSTLTNLLGIPDAFMTSCKFDQDLNCRRVGRCTTGPTIDREVGDMIPREIDDRGDLVPIPLRRHLGRDFLYARYDIRLERKALHQLGFPNLDPERISRLDSVKQVGNLRRVGREFARTVDIKSHFGTFVAAKRSP